MQQDLFNYSAPFRKVPQFITTFAQYTIAPYPISTFTVLETIPSKFNLARFSRKKPAIPAIVLLLLARIPSGF
jgi:hypothetical protein